MKAKWLYGAGAGLGAAAAYAAVVRPWTHRWGATKEEIEATSPGDDVVPDPNYQATLAIDIAASPEEIWPWLMQMGAGRGGLYSYDWLDRLFGVLDRNSAWTLLPEIDDLKPGDSIPVGRDSATYFPVLSVEKNRVLVLGADDPSGVRWSWTFLLRPLPNGHTRLVSRNRAHVAARPFPRLAMSWIYPAAFVMTRKMLVGLKARAERHLVPRAFAPTMA